MVLESSRYSGTESISPSASPMRPKSSSLTLPVRIFQLSTPETSEIMRSTISALAISIEKKSTPRLLMVAAL